MSLEKEFAAAAGGPHDLQGSNAAWGSGTATQTRLSEPLAEDGSGRDNVKVVVRVRPPVARELHGYVPYQHAIAVAEDGRGLVLSENLEALQANGAGAYYSTYRMPFDMVYDQQSSQEEVYAGCARGAVLSTLQGYNATIIAYGQTGAGKTFTMEGQRDGPGGGIIPRAIHDIFEYIENDSAPNSKYLVRASYLQIYNEVISDLLKPDRANLTVREDRKRGVYVEGLSEWVVRRPAEVFELLERGAVSRRTGATRLNQLSSRSHAVFQIIIEKSAVRSETEADEEQMEQFAAMTPGMARRKTRSFTAAGGQAAAAAAAAIAADAAGGSTTAARSVLCGKLNLVDLAGSERVHITGAVGKRLDESKKINQSLSALGNVIAALTEGGGAGGEGAGGRPHIPYRDSKLTRVLEDSLGGNTRTTFMAMVSPAAEAFPESLSTLKFAARAKRVVNSAVLNEDLDHRTLLRKYERELRRLRSVLQRKQQDLVDKRALLEVEEQKRRAEADKVAAITALEQRSREFMSEKEEKRRLEVKIRAMQSQLLIGGQKIEDTLVFRALLAREQRRIRGEYEQRLQDLERERTAVEAGRQQSEAQRGLLLKQRDIMVALTGRLTERDEAILALQEELEALDTAKKQLEDVLDKRNAEIIALRKAAMTGLGPGSGGGSCEQPGTPAEPGEGGDDPGRSSGGPGAATPGSPVNVSMLFESGDRGSVGAASVGGLSVGSSASDAAHAAAMAAAGDGDEGGAGPSAAAGLAQGRGVSYNRRDSRASSGATIGGDSAAMQEQVASLSAQLAAARLANEQLAANLQQAQQQQRGSGTSGKGEGSGSQELMQRVEVLSKERQAIQTILQGKLHSMSRQLAAGLQQQQQEEGDGRDGGGSAKGDGQQQLTQQAAQLHKLIGAVITAMNASAGA